MQNEVRVKYLTLVRFGHARAGDVKGMHGFLNKVAIPLRLMLSFGMDGPNVNKSIIHKDEPVQDREGLSTIGQVPTHLPDSHM